MPAVRANHNPKYRPIPGLLKTMREDEGLTQRALAKRLRKLQSWVNDCEHASRRVDLAEFITWAKACRVEPHEAVDRYLATL